MARTGVRSPPGSGVHPAGRRETNCQQRSRTRLDGTVTNAPPPSISFAGCTATWPAATAAARRMCCCSSGVPSYGAATDQAPMHSMNPRNASSQPRLRVLLSVAGFRSDVVVWSVTAVNHISGATASLTGRLRAYLLGQLGSRQVTGRDRMADQKAGKTALGAAHTLFARGAHRLSRSPAGKRLLDVVSRSVTIQRLTLGGPNPIRAWDDDPLFQALLVDVRRLSLNRPPSLFNLYQLASAVRHLPGDIAEVGVYKGGTARLSRRGRRSRAYPAASRRPRMQWPDGGSAWRTSTSTSNSPYATVATSSTRGWYRAGCSSSTTTASGRASAPGARSTSSSPTSLSGCSTCRPARALLFAVRDLMTPRWPLRPRPKRKATEADPVTHLPGRIGARSSTLGA